MPLLAGIVAALLAAAAPAPVGSGARSAPDDIRARAARILARGDYQTALPEAPPERPPLHLPWLGKLLRVLACGGAAVLAVTALAWLWRRLRPRAGDDPEPPRVATEPAPVEIPIASAEALAAAGRYGATVHALLLDTLAALSRAARLAPALTSREIVARVHLPAPARDALEGLVVAVEVSHFGGAEPGADEYRACLARFHAFLATYRSAT
jgi:hypothetical protein